MEGSERLRERTEREDLIAERLKLQRCPGNKQTAKPPPPPDIWAELRELRDMLVVQSGVEEHVRPDWGTVRGRWKSRQT